MRWQVALLALTLDMAVPAGGRPAAPAFRVLGLDPMHAAAVEEALQGAARRLRASECRRIFTDFHDAEGFPLQAALDRAGVAAPEYLSWIVFADGSARRSCRGGRVLAVTARGSRVVFVCSRQFWEAHRRSRARAEVVVLHEALHTLGLGENPPGETEITRRVSRHCAP